jgi:integrase
MARTKPAERARERTLDDSEIRKLWGATSTVNNGFGPLVRFILLTAARRDEAAHMRRSEISGDVWTIPAARNKSKRDVVIPLSTAARAVLDALPIVGDGERVFSHDGRRFLGGYSKFKAKLEQVSGVTGWGLHDLRRTARSLMSRAGVDSNIVERCLGHVIPGVRGVYDRYQYLREKRDAFEVLAALVGRIVDPQENVVSLRGAQ